MLYWLSLAGAILFEVAGTMSLKYSSEKNSLFWGGLVVICYLISFSLIWYAIKKIDISVAYAIWAGLGTALIALIGWQVFHEPMTGLKILFIALIVIGVMGLQYLSQDSPGGQKTSSINSNHQIKKSINGE